MTRNSRNNENHSQTSETEYMQKFKRLEQIFRKGKVTYRVGIEQVDNMKDGWLRDPRSR